MERIFVAHIIPKNFHVTTRCLPPFVKECHLSILCCFPNNGEKKSSELSLQLTRCDAFDALASVVGVYFDIASTQDVSRYGKDHRSESRMREAHKMVYGKGDKLMRD